MMRTPPGPGRDPAIALLEGQQAVLRQNKKTFSLYTLFIELGTPP